MANIQVLKTSARTSSDGSAATADEMQAGRRFLFVGGVHRSGTTALWKCFKSHPEVSGFSNVNNCHDEGQFEQSVYPIDKDYGHLDWPMHPGVHLTEASPLFTEDNRRKMTKQWYRHWDLRKTFLLEKTPRNLVISRFLQAMFPVSVFAFIIRHPIAHAKSIHRLNWSRRPVEELVERWVKAHQMLRDDLPFIRNSVVVRYEDFVSKPESYFVRMCTRLGLPPATLQVYIEENKNEKHKEDWEHELRTLHVGSQRTRKLWRLEDEVNRFGYSLFNLDLLYPSCVNTLPFFSV
jgi:Sulfotransferase family